MIEGYICIVLCGTCVSVGMHVMAGWLLTLCLSRMSLQPEIMPCWSERSIVTNSLQINRYFIKQLRYKMKYGSFSKMCTNLINDLDHSIKFTYFYLFIRIQEAFNLDKISQLDLNLLNQIPLLISSLFVWDADFFLSLLLLLKPLLELFFWLITLWAIWKCRGESMVEEKAVNASQAFYYCKLMVMICKEVMAGKCWFQCK